MEQEKAAEIELAGRRQLRSRELGPIVKEPLEASLGPALTLAPEGTPSGHGLLLHGRVPEQRNRLLLNQQAETQIEVIGHGGFVEALATEHGLALEQLTVAAQLNDPTRSQAPLLNDGIQGHFHGLGTGQPVEVWIHHGLAQLNR